MEYVIASYEVVPLLSEYASRINPQQLKNALVDRTECARVERLIEEGGKLSANNLYGAVGRVGSCRGADRAKVAGRFLQFLVTTATCGGSRLSTPRSTASISLATPSCANFRRERHPVRIPLNR